MAVDPGPSGKDYAVTPHDTNAQPVGRGLFVGVTGNITGRLVDSAVDTLYKNVAQGVEHGLRFSYIRATGTTATDMVILF